MSVVGWLKKLWAEEPIVVSALLPAAASAGILSQTQASALTSAISAVGVAAVQMLTAFGVRRKVTTNATAAQSTATAVSAALADADPVAAAILEVPPVQA